MEVILLEHKKKSDSSPLKKEMLLPRADLKKK